MTPPCRQRNARRYCACFFRPVGKPIASASSGITFRRSINETADWPRAAYYYGGNIIDLIGRDAFRDHDSDEHFEIPRNFTTESEPARRPIADAEQLGGPDLRQVERRDGFPILIRCDHDCGSGTNSVAVQIDRHALPAIRTISA